ncbi:hypothetical protein LWI29_007111 [Acer saccharum]|uniref:Uncharacterized protein n=1 Tax=Acer saccharum TaxID=4024 RepID=A0AA39VY10_ACESA|nr:hypothetical protein LWI29_007111 [Acer saccharum]
MVFIKELSFQSDSGLRRRGIHDLGPVGGKIRCLGLVGNKRRDPNSLSWHQLDPGCESLFAANQNRTENSSSPRIRSRTSSLLRRSPPFCGDTVSQMKYLKPLNFYKEIFKDILMKKDSKHGRLLGLDVSDNYVSLALSDWKNLTAVPLRALHRQENNMSSIADIFQSLIPEHNLVGFVVGTNYELPDTVPFRVSIHSRNRLVHSFLLMNVEEVVGWEKMFLQDFCAAHISIAAASLVGVGVVIRDNRCVMAARLKRYSDSFSIEITESLAVLKGLELASDSNLVTVCLKSY